MKNTSFGVAIAVAALVACSSSKPTPTTSTLEGSVAASSFKSAPSGLVAIDETGARTIIALGPDGSFKKELPKAHTYKLVVAMAAGEEPLVFPRAAGGKLDLTFKISAGGAKVALGAVRHFDAAPAGGFPALVARVECESGEGGDGDGECENGKDAKTGAPCVDDDDVNEAGHDGTKPMAVAEKSPPNDVSGCGDDEDGEETDDD